MKKNLKKFAAHITAMLNRLGEDFDMILLDETQPYPADVTGSNPYDDDLFV